MAHLQVGANQQRGRSQMSGTLIGEIAIVTGGGRGFGEQIALSLAAQGAAVTVVSRNKAQLDSVVALMAANGGKGFAVAADVTDRAAANAAIASAEKKFGAATLLINSAGIDRPFGPIGVVDPDEWWSTQAVHVRGPLLFMSAVLPAMRARRKGCIVTVASRAGIEVTPNMSAYCVAKATQIRLTEHVAAEGKAHGITAFAIQPGTVITEMGAATLNNPDAQRWIPGGIEYLKSVQAAERDPAVREAVFRRCCEMVVDLASGRYQQLSGRYLDPADDFDALLR
jgi:NAD(P)-dependent dehydrogenase (short-subunit alcohol dehydrogenase family)